jgi:tRNA dimethylallyltransferase
MFGRANGPREPARQETRPSDSRQFGKEARCPTIPRMRELFFLVGPTAVGKSALAVEVAEELGAEIVNADAFQIYRELDILTAKPDADAQRRVPHHLLSVVKLSETMSAAEFRRMALASLDEIWQRRKPAIVVSGSGLYVKAITHGFDQVPPPNRNLRVELSSFPLEELTSRLRQLDPLRAARTDLKNPRRVIRAIEIAEGIVSKGNAGIPSEVEGSRDETLKVVMRDLSTSLRSARGDRLSEGARPEALREVSCDNRLREASRDARPGEARGVVLTRDRDDLYSRINERVEEMFREGVEREVAALKNIGPTVIQALGLREIQGLLAGEISREDCIAKIQQATRHYAKRQLTWFRHRTNFLQLNLTALSHRKAISAIMRIIAQQ